MCNLCGTEEERQNGRKSEGIKADDFQRMANYCRGLATGNIKPHSDDMKPVVLLAKTLLRTLVNDYI